MDKIINQLNLELLVEPIYCKCGQSNFKCLGFTTEEHTIVMMCLGCGNIVSVISEQYKVPVEEKAVKDNKNK